MESRNSSEKHGTLEGAWLAADFLSEQPIQNDSGERLIQLCGNCSHQGAAYHSEWQGTNDHLREYFCPNCSSPCFRYTIPVVIESIANNWGSAAAREYCRARADLDFWQGKVVADSSVDNPMGFIQEAEAGLANMRRESMIQAVEWIPNCPCCGVSAENDTEFNFHHWDYETDQGVQICDECHRYIHRNSTATEQAKNYGVDWKVDAAERIISQATMSGIVTDLPQVRFNIPEKILDKIDDSTKHVY